MDKDMSLRQCVGKNIRKYRLANGLSLENMANKIFKSKSTISKYENGSIALDVETLGEIANALNVHPSQLLATPVASKAFPAKQDYLDDIYMYSYDGKSKRIIKSVIERYQTDTPGVYSTQLFYDIPSVKHIAECAIFYQGTSTKHDILENYSLVNTHHDIEQLWLCCIGSLSQTKFQVGFLAGLSNATLFPAVRKVVLSPDLLSEEELLEHLLFTKEDLQKVKKSNVFIIDEFVV